MESRPVFGFAIDPEYSEEKMARMDAHRCIEEADLCDFNNALIRGFGMLLQGSIFVVAMVANATMFSHLLPGCSCGSKHLLLPYILSIVNLVLAFLCNVCNAISKDDRGSSVVEIHLTVSVFFLCVFFLYVHFYYHKISFATLSCTW